MNKFTWLIDFNIFLRSHKTAVPLRQFQQDMTQNIIGKENSERVTPFSKGDYRRNVKIH